MTCVILGLISLLVWFRNVTLHLKVIVFLILVARFKRISNLHCFKVLNLFMFHVQSDVNTVCFADESGHLIYSGSDDNLCKVNIVPTIKLIVLSFILSFWYVLNANEVYKTTIWSVARKFTICLGILVSLLSLLVNLNEEISKVTTW